MKTTLPGLMLLLCAPLAGCRLPGHRAAEVTPQRPDQIIDFHTLYSSNCAACHGTEGRQGAAISLANPAYLAYAGEQNIAQVTAQGITGSLMPAFAREHGGLLTDAQVNIIAHGMVSRWGHPEALHGDTPPPYISSAVGDSGRGEAGYRQQCLRCHAPGVGSILDPAYLALISDGGLRSIIVAGKPEQGMPDWAGYGGVPFTEGQIADLVAFLASRRARTPGQPYPNRARGNPSSTVDKTKPSAAPAREKVSH